MENIHFNKEYKVRPVYGKHVERFIVQNHYAQRVPQIMYSFGLFEKNKMIGVIAFGLPPSPPLHRKIPFDYLELNRIALIKHKKNLVSWWLSKCIGLLPKPLLLISFADKNKGHIGYVYQATNWIYTGLSTAVPGFIVRGIIKHDRHIKDKSKYKKIDTLPKHRYFLPIGSKLKKKQMKKWVTENYKVQPYPKGESKRYDMNEEREKLSSFSTNKFF